MGRHNPSFEVVSLHRRTALAADLAEKQGLPETARVLFAIAAALPADVQASGNVKRHKAELAEHLRLVSVS